MRSTTFTPTSNPAPRRLRRAALFGVASATALGLSLGPMLGTGPAGADPVGHADPADPATVDISPFAGGVGTIIGIVGHCPTGTNRATVGFGPQQSDVFFVEHAAELAADGSVISQIIVPAELGEDSPDGGAFGVLLTCDDGSDSFPRAFAPFLLDPTPPATTVPPASTAPTVAPSVPRTTAPTAAPVVVHPAFTG